ncbi:MAG: YgjV family protein [Lachnospiraceae bacterium]|nr:YgjV family protein [Lachnospiraceae bacterium]MBR5765435.1 YgjV family protein [Lachnospiraceae bacterium]MBR6485583.1 YgjV family protein [Lachnospiraceae bacterium]
MDIKFIIEMIGYIGSALVLVSMLMTSVVRLRIINLTGSIIFAGYAIAIRSYPTAIMNICLAGINIFHLVRIFREERIYTLIKTDVKDGYFAYLLNKSDEDIRHWFPEYSLKDIHPDIAYLVCCESNPACLFLGKELNDGAVEALLDYATPAYRDTSVGRYLYESMAKEGYGSIIFKQKAEGHIPYLNKMGYRLNADGAYELDLK